MSEPVSEDLHYTTVDDLTSFGAHGKDEKRRVSGLPSIQVFVYSTDRKSLIVDMVDDLAFIIWRIYTNLTPDPKKWLCHPIKDRKSGD